MMGKAAREEHRTAPHCLCSQEADTTGSGPAVVVKGPLPRDTPPPAMLCLLKVPQTSKTRGLQEAE